MEIMGCEGNDGVGDAAPPFTCTALTLLPPPAHPRPDCPHPSGTIHQPEVAQETLRLFLQAHRDQLSKLPAQRAYTAQHRAFYFGEGEVESVSEGEEGEEGQQQQQQGGVEEEEKAVAEEGTLLQLVEAGVADANIATSVVSE